jgi:hypothetical protein
VLATRSSRTFAGTWVGYFLAIARKVARNVVLWLAAIAYLVYASSASPDASRISSQARAIAIGLSFSARLASA